jgi:hypothetical protein
MAVVNKTLLGRVVLPGSGADTYTLEASALTANVQQADVRVLCNTTAGVVTCTLPEISTFNGLWQGMRIVFVDAQGNANANNITINRAGSDTIEGGANHVVTVNSKCVILRVADEGMWELSS